MSTGLTFGPALPATVGDAFSSVTTSGSLLLAVPVALAAGAVSFFSPCVLPLVPGYLSYVTGMTGEQLRSADAGRTARAALGVLLFVAGFAVWFVGLGMVFGGAGLFLREHRTAVDRVLGVVVVLLGLAFAGLVRPLQRDVRVHRVPAVGLGAAPLLGLFFGVGWTPCVGPTLSAVTSLSLQEGGVGRGAVLAGVYCLGLGLPFLAVAVLFGRAAGTLSWFRRHARAVARTGGAMLVVVGVLLLTGVWTQAVVALQGWLGPVSSPV